MLHKNDCALCTFTNSEPTVGPAICLLMKHFLLRRARKYATIKLTRPHCAVFSFLLAKFKFKSSSSRVSEFILATKCRSRMVLPPSPFLSLSLVFAIVPAGAHFVGLLAENVISVDYSGKLLIKTLEVDPPASYKYPVDSN